MIDLHDWRGFSQHEVGDFIASTKYTLVLIGQIDCSDERSRLISDYLCDKNVPFSVVSYCQDENLFKVGSKQFEAPNFHGFNKFDGTILIDATSVGVPELVYLMRWANEVGQLIDIIYVEPGLYNSEVQDKSSVGADRQKFLLSEDGPGISMLPGYLASTNNSHLVVTLGFEGHRFGGLLSSDEMSNAGGCRISGLLSIPPVNIGWERISLSKNYRAIEDSLRMTDHAADFQVVAACDPYGRNESLIFAPFGTKPNSLAIAWFVANNPKCSLLYDFSKVKKNSSSGVGNVHLWSFRS